MRLSAATDISTDDHFNEYHMKRSLSEATFSSNLLHTTRRRDTLIIKWKIVSDMTSVDYGIIQEDFLSTD